jgi:hypothetical protein
MKNFINKTETIYSTKGTYLEALNHEQINRKNFIQKIGFLTLLLSIPELSAEESEMLKNQKSFSDLNKVAEFLKTNRELVLKADTNGEWKLGKILSHCAQSIEYSMVGFPDNKSKLFQWTLGSVAFMVFSVRGRMSHGLSEPIPGAEPISDETKIEDGIIRLTNAIDRFQSTKSKDLKPHFAYGNLDKADYDAAHTFHINNHFEELIQI